MAKLTQYNYIFGLGTCFALLEAYNNGANDVANSWATSVSSRSITYPAAMICALVFELVGALAVGARTASTIKNGIISPEAFQNNAGVQLLAFACASAGAGTWVHICSMNNITVSSTYALVSSLIGVGIATVGVQGVSWGWEEGSGVAAIFAGLLMAPIASAGFGAIIFMLVKVTVHMRKTVASSVRWAVYTSPAFFLIAGTICTLTIVYKGSPNLGLDEKPIWYIVAVTLGVGFGLCFLSALFFMPFVHAKVIKKDYTLKWYDAFKGPLLFKRPAPADAEAVAAKVPNYHVMRTADSDSDSDNDVVRTTDEIAGKTDAPASSDDQEKEAVRREQTGTTQDDYKLMLAAAEERHHAKLRQTKGPLGWAMRQVHDNHRGAGSIYELKNIVALLKQLPAYPVIGLLYGAYYDIHEAQIGIEGTPEGKRMARTYAAAPKYPNEVEFLYSFVQIITACTASFAHGANDVGNAVGVWAGMYAAWSTGETAASKEPVPTWQIAVMALTICIGFITYGYNIMKVMGNKITYHSPSRGSSMEMGAAITTLIFSQYSLPVSTTMCITGSTVGVGLCNGKMSAVNWNRLALVMCGWIITVPCAGLIGGCIMGLALNTPHF